MPGQVLPRKYRIERYLAEGGMGAIYVGKKLGAGGFEKEVVLKQLLPEFASRPEFRDLFFREAGISATLDHVNIVRTYDLVRSEDALFIVMEYVRGADLRTIAWRARRRGQPLSVAAVLHVALEVLAGLAYAHTRRSKQGEPLGIIHRDVSPSNILCSVGGEVKLSDFGIAKAVNYASVFYRVRGKVGYMSPEMAHNQPLDARSDLFSLAVCVYETLTGERLFPGELLTPPEIVYNQPVPPLGARCPGAPPALEAVLRRGLAQEPGRRFQDAGSFALALRDVVRRHGLDYSPPALAAELTGLLGPNSEGWLRDDPAAHSATESPFRPGKREGQEVSSVRLGDDTPDDDGDRLGGPPAASQPSLSDARASSPPDLPPIASSQPTMATPPLSASSEPTPSFAEVLAARSRLSRPWVWAGAAALLLLALWAVRAFGAEAQLPRERVTSHAAVRCP